MSIEQDCRETVVFSLMKAKAWTKPQAEEYVSLWLEHSTAIQQAEAKTDEPVAWGWAIVDNKGLERRTRARLQDFFGSTQEAKPFSLEDVAREDREFAGCAPHRVITLFTHPAPGVPEGWGDLAQRCLTAMQMAVHFYTTGRGRPPDQTCQLEIEELSAMLTAAQAQKG